MSFQFTVDTAEQREAVLADTWLLPDGSCANPIEVAWQTALLDLAGADLDEGERRQVGLHPAGLAIRREPLNAISYGDRIAIGGNDSDPETLLDAYGSTFTAALTHVMAQQGLFPIHGAGVARNGDALLVLGKPGQGKSSAVWGAHHAGFDLLGDDTVFVRPTDEGLEICGFRKPVAVPREVLDRIPPGATQDRLHGGSRDRWELLPDMLAPGWHRVRGVITPVHGSEPEGRLTSRSGTDLLRLAVGAYYASAHPSQLQPWFPHAAALCRLPAWDLHHSPDVERRLETAAHWLGVALDEATA